MNDPELEPLIEIMSQHGTFEWFGRKYLAAGHQVGFIAASDNHLSQPGFTAATAGGLSQRGGLGALIANASTRDALFDAMRSRATYATTGDRIILDAAVNGAAMGARVPFAEARRITGRAIGTAPIASVDVLRNGERIWRRDYLTDADGRGIGGDYVLTFESASVPFHPGDNPRGWRWWWGTVEVDGATVADVEGMDFTNNDTHSIDLTDGTSIAFRTHTRGDTSSLRLTLAEVRRPASLVVKLREGREFGGGPPRFRPHQLVPAAEVELPLRDLANGVVRRTLDFDGYVDTVTLRRVVTDGPLEVSFDVEDFGTRQGDTYYVRVTQTNDAIAWSSPVWVGGFAPR